MQDEGKVAFAEDVHLKLNSRCFVLLMSVMTDIRFSKMGHYLREISFKGEMKGAAELS